MHVRFSLIGISVFTGITMVRSPIAYVRQRIACTLAASEPYEL